MHKVLGITAVIRALSKAPVSHTYVVGVVRLIGLVIACSILSITLLVSLLMALHQYLIINGMAAWASLSIVSLAIFSLLLMGIILTIISSRKLAAKSIISNWDHPLFDYLEPIISEFARGFQEGEATNHGKNATSEANQNQ